MTNEIIQSEKIQALAKETENIFKLCQGYIVNNNESCVSASYVLKNIKSKTDELEDLRKSMTKPLDLAKKNIMEFFRQPIDRLIQAEVNIKRAIIFYHQDQERERLISEAKLRALAKIEEEKQRKLLEKKAEKAEIKGDLHAAKKLQQQAQEIYMPVPIVPSQVEKVSGISTRQNWYAEIVDFWALLKAVLEGKVDVTLIEPNMKALNAMAKINRDVVSIPGVKFLCEDILTARR